VLVSSDGYVITNRHVIEGSHSIQVCFSNNTGTKGAVVHQHPEKDLAIVKAAVTGANFIDLQKDCNNSIEVGEEIIALGHPHGHRFTATKGIVSVVRQRVNKSYFLQHDVAINPGNSGGPLLDDTAHFIGLNTFIHRNSHGLGFAIPACEIAEYFLDVSQDIASGRIGVPRDDEMLDSAPQASPEESLSGALMSFDGAISKSENGSYSLTTPRVDSVTACISGEFIFCFSLVADLSGVAGKNVTLLRYLLEKNDQLVQVSFAVDNESTLWLQGRRHTAGMDAMEAYSLIQNVISAVEEYAKPISKFIDEMWEDDDDWDDESA
jgi:hypothetical protein